MAPGGVLGWSPARSKRELRSPVPRDAMNATTLPFPQRLMHLSAVTGTPSRIGKGVTGGYLPVLQGGPNDGRDRWRNRKNEGLLARLPSCLRESGARFAAPGRSGPVRSSPAHAVVTSQNMLCFDADLTVRIYRERNKMSLPPRGPPPAKPPFPKPITTPPKPDNPPRKP
jgi:hypothetical protein